ncbi:nuclear transport factor 2 family protein [Deinococcus sp. SL84]|uniref:nuclear transport factor 2 family protein n=1 Tax=Deinococcus sp. SL84 TaxID=2994663 RepID=UPI002274DC4B|nr:nuclear transport factor 2 family protein [Deinococcus sp. SL84]MCY1703871.1 nuclear transport factor 2 family protein [Deinococcus sp. SL84]
MTNPTTAPVETFFQAFAKGDMPALLDTLHPDIILSSDGPSNVPWYGTFHGHEGAKDMLGRLGSNVTTQAFEIKGIVGEGNLAMATGTLHHQINSTGKPFKGAWALVCDIQDGKIKTYRFFEDTAAAGVAFQ